MKRIRMGTILLVSLVLLSCNTQVSVKNSINEDGDILLAMVDVDVFHFVDGNFAGQSHIDSIPDRVSSTGIVIPKNVEYIKIECNLVRQVPDSSLLGMIMDKEMLEGRRFKFSQFFYIEHETINTFEITGKTKYFSEKEN